MKMLQEASGDTDEGLWVDNWKQKDLNQKGE